LPASSFLSRRPDYRTVGGPGDPAGGATALAPATPDPTTTFTTGFGTLLAEIGSTDGRLPRAVLRDIDPGNRPQLTRRPTASRTPALAGKPERYQLSGEIARGGMGAIIRGRDVDLGRELVLKVMLESHKGKPDLISRFVEPSRLWPLITTQPQLPSARKARKRTVRSALRFGPSSSTRESPSCASRSASSPTRPSPICVAISLREQRKFAEVVTEYREALRLEPGSLWAQNGLGTALLCLGKMDEAVAEYRELARQKPADASGQAALAYALALAPNRPRQDYDEALIHARHAAQAKPDEFNVIGTLALAEYRAAHWSESLAAAERSLGLRTAVAQTPAVRKGDNAETLFVKALAHWHQGEKEQACAAFDQAADIAKKYPAPDADIVGRISNEAAVVLGRAKRSW
jgi:tetratricopeptide (TPR) repeat protein